MTTAPKALAAIAAATLALTTAACSASTPAETTAPSASDAPVVDTKTHIKIGFNPGPYKQMFEEGILPILEEDGYTVESIDFTDGIVVNVAVATGEIDANIMQHPVYLEFVNDQEGLDNVGLVQIPTPRMGLFGGKRSSLEEVTEGATVTVPNSPSNLYRGLLILRDIGWIDFDDIDNPNTADLSIITANPYNLNITPIENAQQVPALQDVDYATIQGNFIVSGGLDYADALAVEDQPVFFSNVVTVRSEDVDAPWAVAIRDAYQSPEFIEYITTNPIYDGYAVPEWFE